MFGQLVIEPNAHYYGSITVTITIDDQGSHGSGGSLNASASYTLVVDPVNDALNVSVSGNMSLSIAEDTTTSVDDISVTASDSHDSQPNFQHTFTVRSSVASALVYIDSNSTLDSLISSNDVIVTSGTNNTRELEFMSSTGNSGLVFNRIIVAPAANYYGSIVLNISGNDTGSHGSGAPTLDHDTITITVTAVNDRPTISLSNQQTPIDEDTSTTVGSTVTVTSSDSVDQMTGDDMKYTVSVGTDAKAYIVSASSITTLIGSSSLTVRNNNTGTVEFDCTVGNSGTVFGQLVIEPNADYYGSITVTITIDDQGSHGSGGSLSASASYTLVVDPVNDRPTISLSNQQTPIDEDTSTTVGSTVTVTSSDSVDQMTGDDMKYTVSVGTDAKAYIVSASSITTLIGSSSLTVRNNNTGTVEFDCTVGNSGTVFGQLVIEPNAHYYGSITVTITIDDQGSHGSGGSLNASASYTLVVDPVNDRPTISLSNQQTPIDEDTSTTVGSTVTVTSSDSVDQMTGDDMTYTVSVGTDAKAYIVSASSITTLIGSSSLSVGNNNTGTVEFNCTVGNSGTVFGQLVIEPNADYYGSITVTITIDDQGSHGSGGSLNASASYTLVVDPVNDRPTISLSNQQTPIDEDTSTTVGSTVTVTSSDSVDQMTGDDMKYTVSVGTDAKAYIVSASSITTLIGSSSLSSWEQ